MEVFFNVFFGVSFSGFRYLGREVTVLFTYIVVEIVFFFALEKVIPVVVDRLYGRFFNRVVFQYSESSFF